ncbi:MAG: hypothetical protein AAFO99_16470, partial [Bacteroidota bacterium]
MTLKKYINEVGVLIILLLVLHLFRAFLMAHIFAYLLFVVCVVLKKQNLYNGLDRDFLFLLLFSVTYTAFNALGDHKGFQFLVMQIIFPCFFYLLGKVLVVKGMTKKQIVTLLLAIGITYSLTSLISVWLNIIKGGFGQTSRNIAVFWSGESVLATGMAGSLRYNMLIPGVIVSFRNQLSKTFIVCLSLIYVLSLLGAFRLGSRTAIAITALTFVFALVSIFIQQSILKNLKIVFWLTAITVVIIKFFPLNLDLEFFSVLGQRLQDPYASSSTSAGGRTELWEDAVSKLFTHPFGWTSKHYSHNLWLDAAKVSGLIPLVFLLIFNVMNLVTLRNI